MIGSFGLARGHLLDRLRRRGVTEKTLRAVGSTPRHLFVPAAAANLAYGPHEISAPEGAVPPAERVARVLDALDLTDGQTLVVHGSSSGFEAAVAARVAQCVVVPAASERARDAWKACGIENIEVGSDAVRASAIADFRRSATIPADVKNAAARGIRSVIIAGERMIAVVAAADGIAVEDHGAVEPPSQCGPIAGYGPPIEGDVVEGPPEGTYR